MFRRFVLIAILSTVIFCLTLALILAWFHTPIPIQSESGFGLCRVPCWVGIEPGRTAEQDVPGLIRTALPEATIGADMVMILVESPGQELLGVVRTLDEQVTMVQLKAEQPLWQLLLLLGEPACIQYIDRELVPWGVNVFWAQDGVNVLAAVDLSRAGFPVDTLQMWVVPPPFPCTNNANIARWPGYARLEAIPQP